MDAETKYNVATCLVFTSIITCALSLMAIFIAYPTKTCYRPDANSVTVTILSILVTLLIGWNIVFSINSKSKIKNDIKKYVDETIKDTKIEMSEHFILEETTFCNAYAKTKEWDKIFPLLRNSALRYFNLAKQNKKDDFKISGFVSAVAEIMDKIDDESFNELRSDIAGFMEYFKELWKYDKDVSKICELYEQKEKHIKNPPKLTKSQYFTSDIKYAVKQNKDGLVNYICDGCAYDSRFQFSFQKRDLKEAHLFSTPNVAMVAYRDRTYISADEAVNSRPIIISVIESKKETTTL